MCIGLVLAYIAGLTLGDKNNLPRYLLLLLTVYLLILRSESAIAMTYTFWARSVVLLFLMHVLIPKKRADTAKMIAPVTSRIAPVAPRMSSIIPKTSFAKPIVKS